MFGCCTARTKKTPELEHMLFEVAHSLSLQPQAPLSGSMAMVMAMDSSSRIYWARSFGPSPVIHVCDGHNGHHALSFKPEDLDRPCHIIFALSSREVFVADAVGVKVFSKHGKFLRVAFFCEGVRSVAVDSETGEIYAVVGTEVQRLSPDGNLIGSFGKGNIEKNRHACVAVDSVHRLVVVADCTSQLKLFSLDGEFLRTIGEEDLFYTSVSVFSENGLIFASAAEDETSLPYMVGVYTALGQRVGEAFAGLKEIHAMAVGPTGSQIVVAASLEGGAASNSSGGGGGAVKFHVLEPRFGQPTPLTRLIKPKPYFLLRKYSLEIKDPSGICYDPVHSRLYLCNKEKRKVVVFDACSDKHLFSFGSKIFVSPNGITVSQNGQELFVCDKMANAIFRFEKDGKFLDKFTHAHYPSSVVVGANKLMVFEDHDGGRVTVHPMDSSGEMPIKFKGFQAPGYLAFHEDENTLFVSDHHHHLKSFCPTKRAEFRMISGTPLFDCGPPETAVFAKVAVCPKTGIIATVCPSANKLETPDRVVVLDSAGVILMTVKGSFTECVEVAFGHGQELIVCATKHFGEKERPRGFSICAYKLVLPPWEE